MVAGDRRVMEEGEDSEVGVAGRGRQTPHPLTNNRALPTYQAVQITEPP